MSDGRQIEERIAEALALMPWQTRLRFQMRHRAREISGDILRLIPGYRAISFALFRIERQGLSGLWTPPFNIAKQDRSLFDRKLRWHQWGVLRELDGRFRGYTPTQRTAENYSSPEGAWIALEGRYWGRSALDWEPLTRAPKAAP